MSDTKLKPMHVVATLAAIAVVVAAGELLYRAEAQKDNGTVAENVTWSVAAHPVDAMYRSFPFLEIEGSVNITEQVANQILSGAEVSFPEAATIAADSIDDGQVLNGNLGVIGGFLVYSFTVVDDDNRIYSIIVDAGNGDVLHTSEPMDSMPESVVGSIMGGSVGLYHSFGIAQPGIATYKIIEKAETD